MALARDFGRLLILAGVSAAIGLGVNALRPGGLALRGASEPVAQCGAESDARVRDVAADRARTLLESGGAVLLDARPADAFARGHIPGARHLPCSGELALLGLSPGVPVIVYDDGGSHAAEVARSIARKGFDVSLLEGGFAAWGRTGAPAESGACSDCTTTGASHP